MNKPSSTYRLQFNKDFGFVKALEIVSYLEDLGISSIYASPVFNATPGSQHGYDITDPNRINPELGTQPDFEKLIGISREHGLGWIQDIVPNHIAYSSYSYIIADILENGADSRYRGFVDIDLEHIYLRDKVLAPFLGTPFGEALENGELKLNYSERGFFISYYEHRFPLRMETYHTVLSHGLGKLKRKAGKQDPDFIRFLGVLHILKNLPASDETDERYEQIEIAKKMLWDLYSNNKPVKEYVDETLNEFNGEKGRPESFSLLDSLLSEQNFRLSFWKVATEEINYRRFFNINELICVRTEDTEVFEHTHDLILEMVRGGKFTGLRIDHIDGLYDPQHYMSQLRNKTYNLYIVVEKILETGEELPDSWPVEGTTGYEFLNFVNGLFCQSGNSGRFSEIYSGFTGQRISYIELLYEKKKMIIEKHLTGDVDNLANLLKRVSARDRYGSDITLNGLRKALVEIASLFPVYRTYVNSSQMSERDRTVIEQALRRTKTRNPALLTELEYLEKFLLFEFFDYVSEEEKKGWINFVMRFQQLTGPLMAKGFEDTTLYIYNRLISLNEVGGDPDRFGVSVQEFHDFNLNRVKKYPHTLNATSTHDTKRGEDIRARLNVLSEMPDEWDEKIRRWNAENRTKKVKINGTEVPDRNDEYFLYQTITGGLPFKEDEYADFKVRVKEYMVKAVREAKVHTAWLEPDSDYENAFTAFINRIMDFSAPGPFMTDFLDFQKRIAMYGIINSLAQTAVKITSPGAADFYQGTELWDLNFVDPDNRRPVDFQKRMKIIRHIKQCDTPEGVENLVNELTDSREDGRIKMYLIYKLLGFRKGNRDLYDKGEYISLQTVGEHGRNIVAFGRRKGGQWAVTVVPRFTSEIVDHTELPVGKNKWKDTSILVPGDAPEILDNVITGERTENTKNALPAGEILKTFPVALLAGGGPQ